MDDRIQIVFPTTAITNLLKERISDQSSSAVHDSYISHLVDLIRNEVAKTNDDCVIVEEG